MKGFHKLLKLFGLIRKELPRYFIGTAGVSVRNFCITFITAWFSSRVVKTAQVGEGREWALTLGLFAAALAAYCILDASSIYLQTVSLHNISTGLRSTIYDRVIGSDLYCLGIFGDKAEIVSRMNQDVNLAVNLLGNIAPWMYLISGIGATISILTVRGSLGLVAGVYLLAFLLLGVQKWLQGRMKQRKRRQQELSREMTGVYLTSIEQSTNIRLAGHVTYVRKTFEEKADGWREAALSCGRLDAANAMVNQGAQLVQYIGVIVVGIMLYRIGMFSLADIVFIAPLAGLIVTMVTSMGNAFQSISKSMVGVERIFELMDLPQEERNAGGLTTQKEEGPAIQAQDLEFVYMNGTQVLRKESLCVNRGEVTAFEGLSGRGKSTTLRLLLGLYPYQGSLKIWGNEVRDYEKDYLRSQITYVPQNNIIIAGTLRDNICFGSLGKILDGEISETLKQLGAWSWVEANGGLDWILQEGGANLSGGQRQIVAVARAILRKGMLTILDETLSAVDMEGKRRIIQVLREQLHEGAVLIVTHDREVKELCDRVVALG